MFGMVKNVLRYEMRFTSRLPKQFNQTEITASSLSDEKFYMAVFDRWLAEYEAINKLNLINFNLLDMNSPKDFWKQINLMAVNIIGQDKIMQEIENLRHQKAFDKPEYYSRLKKEIRELCKTPEMTASSDLVAELDKKNQSIKKVLQMMAYSKMFHLTKSINKYGNTKNRNNSN